MAAPEPHSPPPAPAELEPPEATGGTRIWRRLTARPWPFHPILLAAYFVLFLYSVNLDESEFADVLPVLFPVVIGTTALLLVAGLIVGNLQRIAIVLSAFVVAMLGYGHVNGILEPMKIGAGWQQLGWAVFGLLSVLIAWRAARWIPSLTRILNIAAIALVIVPIITIVPHELGRASASTGGPPPSASVQPGSTSDDPDIYWFIFDRYPSASSLDRLVGIENPIFDELRSRGFQIAERSHANYQETRLSLRSTFSAEFLDGRGHADLFGATDRSGEFTEISDSNVARFLKARGYYYVHVGSDFSPTRASTIADRNLAYDNYSDFQTAFFQSTAAPAIARRLGIGDSPWKRRYDWAVWELDVLERLPRYPSPTFLFGHVLLPHTPYIFDTDGSYLDEAAQVGRTFEEQFTEQLTYTNRRLLAIIDHLLAVPEADRPIIIIQGDEGPYPVGLRDNTNHDWTKEPPDTREIKYGILNAWYLPDDRDIGLYPEITSVNTFRLLFNAYFDTNLPLLPDESFSQEHPEPLTFPDP
jgi:hypothetical protein